MGKIARQVHDHNENRVGLGRDWVKKHFYAGQSRSRTLSPTFEAKIGGYQDFP